ncbi:MAG: CPBP family intramembrane metalloprotease [Bacteroidaceae bacterium]|nr:CPBP family intramembrane metalloprotease [Bacteroidaceae bacterium]
MNSKVKKSVLDIVLLLIIFGIGQLGGGVIGGIIGSMFGALYGGGYTSWTISIALVTASLLTILLFIVSRYLLIKSHWLEKPDFIAEINLSRLRWHLAPVMLIATFAGAVATGCLGQAWGVKDTLEDTMQELVNNPIGILTIVLIGPLTEEIIFRHGILGGMLRRGVNPWIAILVSSLLFGIIHWNPIQILFATALGVMLGILYTKSQSIIPSLIYHIINNGFAVTVMLITGNEQDPTADLFETPHVLYSAAVVSAAICIPLFIYYWRKPTLPHNQ